MNLNERISGLLGLSQRARAIVSGAFAVEQSLLAGKGVYLILAADAEAETKKKFEELAGRRKLPVCQILSKEELGSCLGKEYRAVALLMERGFGKKLESYLHENP